MPRLCSAGRSCWCREATARGLTAIIGDVSCNEPPYSDMPFFDVGCAEALRKAPCRRNVFHITPHASMRRDAQAMAKSQGRVSAWEPTLVRFGADTLNRRFRERFGTPMTEEAWTAWIATKIIWESALKLQSASPTTLMAHLTTPTAQFDGHKGLPLSFRTWDQQLRQPLYVVDGKRATEVPTALRAGEPARELLDRLGAGPTPSRCHA